MHLFFLLITLIQANGLSISSTSQHAKSISIVTGANGFIGRHVVYSLLQRQESDCILCLVRSKHVLNEQTHWESVNGMNGCSVKVLPYDMLDNGTTLAKALQYGYQHSPEIFCLYHIASTFGPTKDPIQTAHDNVKSAVDAFHTLAKLRVDDKTTKLRLVLTSSMAAVRATNQPPLNNQYYTYKDWNTVSTLEVNNWGSCYQWSKMESERRVMQLVLDWNDKMELGMEFVSLCPSFVFGPPSPSLSDKVDRDSSSYSVQLVKQWMSGESEVQSRLCVDVRDVALAHVQAGTMDLSSLATATPNCYRYILSAEKRLSSEKVSEALKKSFRHDDASATFDLNRIRCDTKFDGGAIKIGEKEVDATKRLQELGVVCRSVEDTMTDMARSFLSDAA